MAERRIQSIPLFKETKFGTSGTTATIDSDVIDLRDISRTGQFSLAFNVSTAGDVASCGSVKFSYWCSQNFDGTYISPTDGTFCTIGNAGSLGTSDVIALTPPVAPFIKIRGVQGTSGTSLITASLNVR
jgi:hypothetical protein